MQINGANASVRLQCVTWDSLEFITVQRQTEISSTVERMFVRTFENGCRPRYECMQLRLVAPGVLLYRRSHYRLWPFNGTTGITVDCRSLFTYDKLGYRLLVSNSDPRARCRLPANVVDRKLDVEFKSGLRCRGFVRVGALSERETEGDETSTSFKLLLRDCPVGHDSEQVYRCLDSSGIRAGKGKTVLVSADSAGGDLLCWWFGNTDPTRFFLLAASACYEDATAATLEPLAVFTRSMSASTSGVVTVTVPNQELAGLENEPVTVITSGSNNTAVNWRLFNALMCVAVVSTTY